METYEIAKKVKTMPYRGKRNPTNENGWYTLENY
jgi:hypothetical protein